MSFLLELEQRKLKYLGRVAKNRQVIIAHEGKSQEEIRLDNLAKSIPDEEFTSIQLNLEKPRTVWVATIKHLS